LAFLTELFEKISSRRVLIFFAASLLLVFCMFWGIYSSYQQALLQSIHTLNMDFVTQVNSTAVSAENVLRNFAAQIYNMHAVSKMRTYPSISNSEMIEGLRILNDFTASSTVLDSIYVYNGKQDYIYSTMSSGAISDHADVFKDTDAVNMLKNRTTDQRMIPIPRMSAVSSSTANRQMISIMIFDIVGGHIPGDNAMMLNISSEWFSELYFGEGPDTASFIVDEDGRLFLSAHGLKSSDCQEILSRLTAAGALKNTNGYLTFHMENGEKKLCFYSRMPGRSWTYVRTVPYAKYLSGLSDMHGTVNIFFIFIFLVAGAASLFISYRVIFPFRYIQSKLSMHAPESGSSDPIDQLNELVRQSADSTHIKNALRTMLREEELRGQLMGYNRPVENSVSSDEYALHPDKAVTPLLVSSIRVQSMLDAIRPLCARCEGVTLTGDHTVLLLQFDDDAILAPLCDKLLALLPGRHIFIGWPSENSQELRLVYERLVQFYRLYFLYPGQSVHMITSDMILEDFSVSCEPYIEHILSALRAGNLESALKEYAVFIEALPGKDHKSVIAVLTQLARSVLKMYYEHFPDAQPAYKAARAQFNASLASLSSITDLEPVFSRWFLEITEHVRHERRSRQSQNIDEVVQLIRDRYQDPALNSQYLADNIGMSSAYLSRIFKQAQGISIADYINHLRIEEAKRLLTQTDIKVMDLGAQLGVENMQYFFVRFKQATGFTPRQYRMQYKRETSQD